MRQLPLELCFPPRFGRDDFLPTPANAAALRMIDRWPGWPDRVALILGPAGAGKSHLAAIWAARTGAYLLTAADLARPDLPALVGGAALLDDADAAAAVDETGLFHLLNLARDTGAWLLLTARAPPDAWRLATPDLLSRLRLAPAVVLEAPDDDLLRNVLVKLFADRQLQVEQAVVATLVLHLDRSLAAARRVVDELDRTALAERRRVTRPMAAAALAAMAPDAGD